MSEINFSLEVVVSHLRSEFEFEEQEKHLFDVVQISPFPKWEYVKWLESKVEKLTTDNKQSAPGCSECGCRILLKGYCAGCQTRVG